MNCPKCKEKLSFKQIMIAAGTHGLTVWKFIDFILNRKQPYRQTMEYKNRQIYINMKMNELKKKLPPHCPVCLTEKVIWTNNNQPI